MSTLVVYESSKGSTKKYAEWISQELETEAVNEKTAMNKDLSNYDCIIFGGWIFGGRICGLDQIRKKPMKKLMVFATGLSPVTEENIEKLKKDNQLNDTPFYYYPGAMQFSKQGFIKKMMLKMVSGQTLKNPDSTEEEKTMAKKMLSDFDDTDVCYIQPLIKACNVC